MKKRMMDGYGLPIQDETIEQFLRTKKASLEEQYIADLTAIAEKYVAGLFDSLPSKST